MRECINGRRGVASAIEGVWRQEPKGNEMGGGVGRGKGVEREKKRRERFLGVGVWHENKEEGLAFGPTCA